MRSALSSKELAAAVRTETPGNQAPTERRVDDPNHMTVGHKQDLGQRKRLIESGPETSSVGRYSKRRTSSRPTPLTTPDTGAHAHEPCEESTSIV